MPVPTVQYYLLERIARMKIAFIHKNARSWLEDLPRNTRHPRKEKKKKHNARSASTHVQANNGFPVPARGSSGSGTAGRREYHRLGQIRRVHRRDDARGRGQVVPGGAARDYRHPRRVKLVLLLVSLVGLVLLVLPLERGQGGGHDALVVQLVVVFHKLHPTEAEHVRGGGRGRRVGRPLEAGGRGSLG